MRLAAILATAVALAAGAALAAEPGGITVQVIEPRPADLGARPSVGFAKLVVTDMDRTLRFYREVMGMTEAVRITAPTFLEIGLKYPGAEQPHLTLVKPSPAPARIEAGNAFGPLGIYTPELHAIVDRARKAGARIVQEPRDMPQNGVVVAVIEDPDGRPLELVQMLRP
jgi:lactoylglutathione lyase